ncbi:MAG: DUF5106 domain-containing protein [Prevotellaceae bacterium]|nr:DUF5106 domain-containing protein [Prevotellaceae bacterium]
MKKSILIISALLLALLPQAEAQAQESSLELPLPAVPSELTQPHERAAFIMEHFWDALDFSDTTLGTDSMFVELNFVNFLSLFPHATVEAGEHSMGYLLERAAPNPPFLHLLADYAEKYLGDAGSPMRNEELFILFLEQYLSIGSVTETERLRPESLLSTAKKNRQGTQAADFSYVTREGDKASLYENTAAMLLLVFYDPACPHCSETLDELDKNPLLGKMIEEGSLSVLAVYTEGNQELWDETKMSMPEKWTVGIDASEIVDKAIYDLPAMPVIYLLGSDKTVLLKDPIPAELFDYLTRAESTSM